MKEYQKVRSTVKPEPKVIDEFSVWVAANITEVKEATGDAETGFEGYEYDLKSQVHKKHFVMCMNYWVKEGVNNYGKGLCKFNH